MYIMVTLKKTDTWLVGTSQQWLIHVPNSACNTNSVWLQSSISHDWPDADHTYCGRFHWMALKEEFLKGMYHGEGRDGSYVISCSDTWREDDTFCRQYVHAIYHLGGFPKLCNLSAKQTCSGGIIARSQLQIYEAMKKSSRKEDASDSTAPEETTKQHNT